MRFMMTSISLATSPSGNCRRSLLINEIASLAATMLEQVEEVSFLLRWTPLYSHKSFAN
ncbi:hypothetical protein Syun_006114 [Stephania yunnanensis]|uniref:Uncharacterized protein n=1 Tax=Stephania yunnanensis TaxID=152371 RepID=A0AAP0PX90_9MAGN